MNEEGGGTDAELIVPVLYEILRPGSVVHYGSGDGAFIRRFKRCGVPRVLGLDSSEGAADLAGSEYEKADLAAPVRRDETFDLVLSLEVGEHIPRERVEVFLENITRLGDVIIFSSALPLQGGKNHMNEQWPSFWADEFSRLGFDVHDVVRPLFWRRREISVWFRQNMLLAVRRERAGTADLFRARSDLPVLDVVHPELYAERVAKLNAIIHGRADLMVYFRLMLKAVLARVGLYRPE